MRRAPRLDRRVTLQRVTIGIDDYGAVTETVVDTELWAALLEAPDDAPVLAGAQVAPIPERRWLVRYRSGVTLPGRVVDDGETYRLNDVSEAPEYGRRRYLRLTGARQP